MTVRTVKDDPSRPWKAVGAFLVTFLGALYNQVQGREDIGHLSAKEWIGIIITALIVTGTVYFVPNPKVHRT